MDGYLIISPYIHQFIDSNPAFCRLFSFLLFFGSNFPHFLGHGLSCGLIYIIVSIIGSLIFIKMAINGLISVNSPHWMVYSHAQQIQEELYVRFLLPQQCMIYHWQVRTWQQMIETLIIVLTFETNCNFEQPLEK